MCMFRFQVLGSSAAPVHTAKLENLTNVAPENAAAWLIHWHFKTAVKVEMLRNNGQLTDAADRTEFRSEFRSILAHGQ